MSLLKRLNYRQLLLLNKVPSPRCCSIHTKSIIPSKQPRLVHLNSVQSNSSLHFYQNKIIEEYASQPVNPSTLRQFIFFGRQMNMERLVTSANWVRNELLIRLAHRIRDFQQLPFIVGTNPHIEYVYQLYWGAFESFRKFPPIRKESDNMKFCELLRDLLEDGQLVLPRLARGLSESTAYYPPDQNDLDLFLNRMLRSRISRRVLAEQHLALTEACEHQWDQTLGYGDGYVGIIFVHCSAQQIVNRAKSLVYQHIERYNEEMTNEKFLPPEIEVTIHQNRQENKNEILFAYVSVYGILCKVTNIN